MFTRCAVLTTLAIGVAGLAGCASDEAERSEAQADAPAAEAEALQVADAGTVRGRVQFQGTAPQPERIDMSDEPACAEKHPGGPVSRAVAVNDNGTLRNVFVYVREGLPSGQRYPTPRAAVTIDQDGCVYEPRVVGVQTGQQLVLKNSDGLLHNINAKPSANRGFNISQPRNMESTRSFNTREVMIPVSCDVHGWMQAYIGVLDHPYFAVTREDGSFEIANLPPGDYVLEAWHERYGTQTMNVTVGPNETHDADFTYNAGMAQGAVVPLGPPLDPHQHAAGAHRHAAGGAAAGRR